MSPDSLIVYQDFFNIDQAIIVVVKSINCLSNNYGFNKKTCICMADSDSTLMILPSGNLGKCEHNLDSYFIGNIYEDFYDTSIINEFKEVRIPLKDCPSCKWWPICRKLDKCPYAKTDCNEIYRKNKEKELELLIRKMYFKYCNNSIDDSNSKT